MIEVKTLKLSDIKPNPKNPRVIKDGAFKKLVDSLKNYPEMTEVREIVVNSDMVIVGGNMRYRAMQEAGWTEAPVKILPKDWTQDQINHFIIEDNIASGEWDWDKLANEWDLELLDEWGLDVPNDVNDDVEHKSLSERFIIPPFSVLDTRQGYWQERRRSWLNLGINSELGRGEGLLGMQHIDRGSSRKNADQRSNLQDAPVKPSWAAGTGTANMAAGTSIFDPVLCELAYRWFLPDSNSHILDPFAGGSVRGIVATKLGYKYTGIELSQKQIEANIAQGKDITPDNQPRWIVGDSNRKLDDLKQDYDLIFTCPPYMDLEVYSDNEDDISNKSDDDFWILYKSILTKAVKKLKENRFYVVVIGEVRGKNGGAYKNFIPKTINVLNSIGLNYYNEMILVNSVGSLPIRINKQFGTNRKIGKCHQNVLVFYKGDPKNIKDNYPKLDFSDIDKLLEND